MINNQWVFGAGAGVDFNGGASPTSGFANDNKEGCASVSDEQGNLLFYTDGVSVWDSENQLRVNGLLGSESSSNSAIILRDLTAKDSYYIFTTSGSSGGNHHLAGVKLNTDTWQAVLLNDQLPSGEGLSPTEKLVAFSFPNCKGYWVLTIVQRGQREINRIESGILRVIKIDNEGISHHDDFDLGGVKVDDIGCLCAHPIGKHLAFANFGLEEVIYMNFNPHTGTPFMDSIKRISVDHALPVSFDNPEANSRHPKRPYGVAISEKTNFLYYTVVGLANGDSPRANGYVYQVDLRTFEQELLGIHENKDKGTFAIGAIQYGPDGDMYIPQSGENFLAAIRKPDQRGEDAGLRWDHLALDAPCKLGLPGHVPTCPLQVVTGSPCSCGTCHDEKDEDIETLNQRARGRFHHQIAGDMCNEVFPKACSRTAVQKEEKIQPCFSLHWGDGPMDKIESHDTEIFYLTVLNPYKDIRFEGLRITSVQLVPAPDAEGVRIVPDRLVEIGCLEPCSSQSREFTILTRDREAVGKYNLVVHYCFERISLTDRIQSSVIHFPVEIVQD